MKTQFLAKLGKNKKRHLVVAIILKVLNENTVLAWKYMKKHNRLKCSLHQ